MWSENSFTFRWESMSRGSFDSEKARLEASHSGGAFAHRRWRPYVGSSASRSPIIYAQIEGRRPTSTTPDKSSALALREHSSSVPYPFEEGFYVVGELLEKSKDGNSLSKKDFDETAEPDDDYIYVIKHITGSSNIWQWWPQVCSVAVTILITSISLKYHSAGFCLFICCGRWHLRLKFVFNFERVAHLILIPLLMF